MSFDLSLWRFFIDKLNDRFLNRLNDRCLDLTAGENPDLAQQADDWIAGLGTHRQPVLRALLLDLDGRRIRARVIGTNDLYEPAITG